MAEKKITTEKVSIDAQGKQVKIGDTVYSFAKNYRSLVEAKVIDITPKTLLVEYINNWNYSPGEKEQYRVGSDQIMLKITEDICKETAKEILDYFDKYAGTGKYLIGNMIYSQRKKYGIEVEE